MKKEIAKIRKIINKDRNLGGSIVKINQNVPISSGIMELILKTVLIVRYMVKIMLLIT
jgi:hypothetical protein